MHPSIATFPTFYIRIVWMKWNECIKNPLDMAKRAKMHHHKVCDVDWTRAAQEVRSYAAWRRPKTAVMQKYNPQFDYGPVIDVQT